MQLLNKGISMIVVNNKDLFKEYDKLHDNLLIQIFVILVLVDIFTGIAKNYNNLSSHFGLKGLIKHLLVVMLVVTTVPYLELIDLGYVADAFVTYYIAFYGISIIENWEQMGIPFPGKLKKFLMTKQEELDNEN